MSVVTVPYVGIGISLGFSVVGTTFTPLALLKDDCEFSGFENAVVEIKILASGNVTKVGGRTDNGSFTGSCYLVNADAGVTELFALAVSKVLTFWQVQLPDGTSSTTGTIYAFKGFVSSVKPGAFSGEDAPTLDFEIAISGAVTITTAT
jgi:hypothetical protein